MYGLLAIALAVGAAALFGSKLLIAIGLVVAVANFAFPFGLLLLVGLGVLLTWRNQHRAVQWGNPE